MAATELKEILKECSVLCAYGAAEGSLYNACRAWLRKKEDHFLVLVEADEAAFLRAKEYPLARDPQVRLLFYSEGDQGIFSTIVWEFLFLKMAHLPSSDPKAVAFFQELASFEHGVTLLASDWRDMGEKVCSNILQNLEFLNSSLLGASLKGACADMPAIICGAGASLDLLAPQLKELKDKALLIGAGSAASALNVRGIIPHLYAFVDPNPPRARFRAQCNFEIPCVYQNRFSTELLSQVHGCRIWMAGTGNYPIEEWLETACGIDAARCDSGWTVATFAVYVALHLGCNPIVLAGMDFACTPDVIYASGLSGEENRQQLIAFTDSQGILRHSKRDWLMSAEWIASTAAAHSERTWINVSKGIPIRGVLQMEFVEVVASYLQSSQDIDAHLFTALSQAASVGLNPEKCSESKKELQQSVEICAASCDKLLALWEKSFPQAPISNAEYALIEVELETEVCARYFLDPLWQMWKNPILRSEKHPFGAHLHRILFYKKALESFIKVLA